MNSEYLRQLSEKQVISLLKEQLAAAEEVAQSPDQWSPIRFNATPESPLMEFGNFKIWPRNIPGLELVYKCDHCGKDIVGEAYTLVMEFKDASVHNSYWHPECRESAL